MNYTRGVDFGGGAGKGTLLSGMATVFVRQPGI
jgi:hypothetical protein